MLSPSGQLAKVGCGQRGSLKGVVYQQKQAPLGWLVMVDGLLLHASSDDEWAPLKWQIIDQDTLEVSVRACVRVCVRACVLCTPLLVLVQIKEELERPGNPLSKPPPTVQVLSDGHVIYHVTMDQSVQVGEKSSSEAKPIPVQISQLKLVQVQYCTV